MSMIKTTSEIDIYTVEGKDTSPLNRPKLSVRNVRPSTHMVELAVDDHRWTVTRADLLAALAATDHCGSR